MSANELSEIVSPRPRASLLTVSEFARQHAMSESHARALIRAGKVDAVRNGRRVLITASSAEAFAASLPRVNV